MIRLAASDDIDFYIHTKLSNAKKLGTTAGDLLCHVHESLTAKWRTLEWSPLQHRAYLEDGTQYTTWK
jgi:hypothetical protein